MGSPSDWRAKEHTTIWPFSLMQFTVHKLRGTYSVAEEVTAYKAIQLCSFAARVRWMQAWRPVPGKDAPFTNHLLTQDQSQNKLTGLVAGFQKLHSHSSQKWLAHLTSGQPLSSWQENQTRSDHMLAAPCKM